MTRKNPKYFLVMGATGSLGVAITHHLAQDGALLRLSGRDSEKLGNLVSQCEGSSAFACDLNLKEDRAALARDCHAVDGVVLASGVAPLAPLRYLKDDTLSECFATNTEGPILLVRDLVKAKKLNPGASIVFISSIAATKGTAGYTAYSASKAAVEAGARCLARELAGKRIRVNCIAPGMVATEMSDQAAADFSEEALAAHLAEYPLGAGSPGDIAGAVAFFLSDASRWITGTVLPVDGGFSV